MRLIALLSIAMITLSGCAVQVSYDEGPTVTKTTTSSCSVTQNGVTRDCSAGPTGPKENVTIDERAPITDGIDLSWSFSVHPGANTTQIMFNFDGHDGGGVGVIPDRGCIKLDGPSSKTAGSCTNGGTNLQVNANGVIVSPSTVLSLDALAVGDYTLSANVPRALADYHVAINIAY